MDMEVEDERGNEEKMANVIVLEWDELEGRKAREWIIIERVN